MEKKKRKRERKADTVQIHLLSVRIMTIYHLRFTPAR